ncbi:hypothetical protein HZS55_14585 [Halosimplex rubrum]|uniref:Uncharacterized protein n=1 Tax=Halosimplex rubrum TaxID=869889 RepID=A0A7D5P185_9EURY|nr:hypothetical protein [Halosimplex rubrum]QLH78446.1 hypothetical protein HZS55_14585 [Halosimplex rubrum]
MNDTFWDTVCGMLPWFRLLIVIDTVVLFLVGFSLLHVEPDSGAFIAALMTLTIVLITLVVFGLISRQCAARDEVPLD